MMSGLPEITGRASCADWAGFAVGAQASALSDATTTVVFVVIVCAAAVAIALVLRLIAAERAARERYEAAERLAAERHQAAMAAIREASAWAGYYRDLAAALLRPGGGE